MCRRSSDGRDSKGASDNNNDIDGSGPSAVYFGCDMVVFGLVRCEEVFDMDLLS
jgi:hypothetical protein